MFSLRNEDCMVGLDGIPDGSVDLVVMDPPYSFDEGEGGGAFGAEARGYHKEYSGFADGISDEMLEKIVRKMRKVNMYVWCNKNQLRQYIDFFDDRGCSMDLLVWAKSNPVPMCCEKYLSDLEYCLFFREKGVHLYGTFETKRKLFHTQTNRRDKERYGHPTVKPLAIIETLVNNSIPPEEKEREGFVVMDPFMGTGTTGVACKKAGTGFIGFEIDPRWFAVAERRIGSAGKEKGLDGYFDGKEEEE